jgi:diguanylate cyclase (GGDEF)-like protein
MALFFIDLDYFKEVNDNFGHRVGDKLLQNIAKRLTDNSKEGDTIARIGGDEFTLLLTEMRAVDHICKACHQIVEKLRQPYHIEGQVLNITTSIGIAVYPDDGKTEKELMKNADIAMYRAKDIGRNSYQLFTPSMNAHSLERSLIQSHLRLALDNNELILNYQPQTDGLTNKIVGVEALLRWSNPILGQISPGQFIPMAEELGLITEVDNWVLKHACEQRKTWLDQGVDCGRVAVNISALHFHQGDLISSVESVLAQSQLPAELLEIEVTESCFIKQMDHATSILIQLKEMGVKIALDDFGTGFSSLSYLTSLPIDTLKIDASFIAKIPYHFRESQITSSIVALAQSLNLDIVAEGVETTAQKLFLLDRGCDVMQGYLYSKPVSAQHLPNLTRALCVSE